MRKKTTVVVAFVVAVLFTGLAGSILQTQVNLAALRDIGPPVSFALRAETTWLDILHFSPLYTAIVACTFLIAFVVAEWIARLFPGHRLIWLTLAAVLGLWSAFQLVDALAPMPTLIAATRGMGGTLILLTAAAAGAVFYVLMTKPLNSAKDETDDDL